MSFNVITIDGGGVRGIIPAYILNKIETELGIDPRKHFKLWAGASTGAIISCLACYTNIIDWKKNRYTTHEILTMYQELSSKVFHRSFWQKVKGMGGLRAKYDNKELERLLKQYLGEASTSLWDINNLFLIPSYNATKHKAKLWDSFDHFIEKGCEIKFNEYGSAFGKGTEEKTYPTLWQLCMMSASAPSYFPLYKFMGELWMDGGLFASTMDMCAYAYAQKRLNNMQPYVIGDLGYEDGIKLLSLGTGLPTDPPITDKNPLITALAPEIIAGCMKGQGDTAIHNAKLILGDNYLRVDGKLNNASDKIDDASDKNINNLLKDAEAIWQANKKAIKEFLGEI